MPLLNPLVQARLPPAGVILALLDRYLEVVSLALSAVGSRRHVDVLLPLLRVCHLVVRQLLEVRACFKLLLLALLVVVLAVVDFLLDTIVLPVECPGSGGVDLGI